MTSDRHRGVRLRGAAAVAGSLLLLAGCGPGVPPQTDPAAARAALTASLDAWKGGHGPQGLAARTPPVDFSDPMWDGGSALTAYEIKSEERSGASVRLTVALTVSKDGRPTRRTAVYTADGKDRFVIRPEF